MEVLETPAVVSPGNNETPNALRKGTLRLSTSRTIATPADVAGDNQTKEQAMATNATAKEMTEDELLAQAEAAEQAAEKARAALAAHRNSKRGDVLARLRAEIKTYGFTGKELGVGGGTVATPSRLPKGDGAKRVKSDKATHPYRGPNEGETYAGKGKHPKWLADALKAGRTLADFKA